MKAVIRMIDLELSVKLVHGPAHANVHAENDVKHAVSDNICIAGIGFIVVIYIEVPGQKGMQYSNDGEA